MGVLSAALRSTAVGLLLIALLALPITGCSKPTGAYSAATLEHPLAYAPTTLDVSRLNRRTHNTYFVAPTEPQPETLPPEPVLGPWVGSDQQVALATVSPFLGGIELRARPSNQGTQDSRQSAGKKARHAGKKKRAGKTGEKKPAGKHRQKHPSRKSPVRPPTRDMKVRGAVSAVIDDIALRVAALINLL